MELPYEIVDVFAERALAGNQLAVVYAPSGLGTPLMQDIAREMNFSETTFVSGAMGDERVRIFTPANELPFAGHPVLGTASVLRARRGGATVPDVTIRLADNTVRVRFDDRHLAWFESPPARQVSECEHAVLAARIGLQVEQLAFDPITVWDIGPRFLLAEVADMAALRALRVSAETVQWLSATFGGFVGLFAFTTDAYGPDAHYAARMLFGVDGAVREDPATGAANACFAAYLTGAKRDPGEVVIVEQGFEIGRPSRIFLRLGDVPEVGGRVQHIATGVLRLP